MTVLCLGSAADETFVHTLEALKREGVPFDALDLGQLAYSGDLRIPLDAPEETVIAFHGRKYRLGAYRSVFVRMLGLALVAPSERLRSRAASQYQAFTHLLTTAPLLVVNPPGNDVSNGAKLFHALALAPPRGWLIPRSCLTRSDEEARNFIASCDDGVIFKGASGAKTWARAFDPATDIDRLERLAACPVLFQERIVGPDVRVHVVGGRCFAEMIESEGPDYRKARGNRFTALTLPPGIAAGCIALSRDSGKPLIGIDFKIMAATGEWFFLEANPQPGYSYYDERSGFAISRAIAELLADGNKSQPISRESMV